MLYSAVPYSTAAAAVYVTERQTANSQTYRQTIQPVSLPYKIIKSRIRQKNERYDE
jgi:hypothetical protein